MEIGIVIPTYNRKRQLNRLLKSLPGDVMVSIMWGKGFLAEKRNNGYKALYNIDYVLFIDDDNVLEKGAIKKAMDCFTDEVAVVGLTALDNGEVESAGADRIYNSGFTKPSIPQKTPYEVSEVSNAFIIRSDVFEELNMFDSDIFPIELDEADFCLRAKKAGYKIVVSPEAITYHEKGKRLPTFRRKQSAYFMGRNRILFQKKHNLSLIFIPFFILIYLVAPYRKHFLKGVWHGIRNKTDYPEEYKL